MLKHKFSAAGLSKRKPWYPKKIGEFNGHSISLTHFKGVFKKHHHITGDELFIVLKGDINMGIPGKNVILKPGDTYVVKRGEVHGPSAAKSSYVITIEVKGTKPIFFSKKFNL